jgi:murein DD-endopeptidase MepM/ murein hydrolase activator NlpD
MVLLPTSLRPLTSFTVLITAAFGLHALFASSPASGKTGREENAQSNQYKAKHREKAPKFEEGPRLAPEPRRRVVSRSTIEGPWAYVLPIDHGVRTDESGHGHFRAPRYHGEHNGLDLLAPLGTPVFAACNGLVTAGNSASFGTWVRVVCPVPRSLASGKQKPHASIFYAHLKRAIVPLETWTHVRKGARVGYVGKTGNARGANVQPHLHLELIIQSSRRAALSERHLGRDQTLVSAATRFFDSLTARCLRPNGFHANSGRVGRARRADPFLVLTCLSSDKPDYHSAPASLDSWSRPWSQLYSAREFNVDAGPRAFLLARR